MIKFWPNFVLNFLTYARVYTVNLVGDNWIYKYTRSCHEQQVKGLQIDIEHWVSHWNIEKIDIDIDIEYLFNVLIFHIDIELNSMFEIQYIEKQLNVFNVSMFLNVSQYLSIFLNISQYFSIFSMFYGYFWYFWLCRMAIFFSWKHNFFSYSKYSESHLM